MAASPVAGDRDGSGWPGARSAPVMGAHPRAAIPAGGSCGRRVAGRARRLARDEGERRAAIAVEALEVFALEVALEGGRVGVDLVEEHAARVGGVEAHVEAVAAGLAFEGASRLLADRGLERLDVVVPDDELDGDDEHG